VEFQRLAAFRPRPTHRFEAAQQRRCGEADSGQAQDPVAGQFLGGQSVDGGLPLIEERRQIGGPLPPFRRVFGRQVRRVDDLGCVLAFGREHMMWTVSR
jgi:hypothetical protein